MLAPFRALLPAALGLLFMACSPAADISLEPAHEHAAAGIADTASIGWEAVEPMYRPRKNHIATLLNDGKVLITGGTASDTSGTEVEVYDPATNTWTPANPMSTSRT